jgi:hypothetical protein
MKIYSEKIGPVEYFRGIGFACFFLPYSMGVPNYWPLCVLVSIGAYWFLGRRVKKDEDILRTAKSGDSRIVKIVLLFAVLVIANAGFIRLLQ